MNDQEFDDFVGAYAKGLKVVASVTLSADSRRFVDDVVQETLIVVYRHRQEFKTHRHASAYALVALRRLIRDLKRKRWVQSELLVARPPDRPDTQEFQVANQDLIAALRMLPVCFRDVVLARYVLEMTAEETGHTLGMTSSAVKAATRNALDELREVLDVSHSELR